ncbi:MAG: hypothetical protein ABIA67_03290 [Candidatus Margulisiibacteriota bacterium]
MKKRTLAFKYERKRIKRDKKLPSLCPDYESREGSNWCLKADFCKNATHVWEDKPGGTCQGGTIDSERQYRKEREKRRMDAK